MSRSIVAEPDNLKNLFVCQTEHTKSPKAGRSFQNKRLNPPRRNRQMCMLQRTALQKMEKRRNDRTSVRVRRPTAPMGMSSATDIVAS